MCFWAFRAHLAGKTVAAGVLGQFAAEVITIHGQNDQLPQDSTKQLAAIDEFAGLTGQAAEFAALRREWMVAAKG